MYIFREISEVYNEICCPILCTGKDIECVGCASWLRGRIGKRRVKWFQMWYLQFVHIPLWHSLQLGKLNLKQSYIRLTHSSHLPACCSLGARSQLVGAEGGRLGGAGGFDTLFIVHPFQRQDSLWFCLFGCFICLLYLFSVCFVHSRSLLGQYLSTTP